MSRFLNDLRNYELNESILDRGIFKAVFMAGAGGSGKSYVLSKVKSGSIEPRIVNIDRFIEYYGHDYEKEYFDRSRKQTTKQLIQYVNSLLPLAIDCTSKNTKKRYKELIFLRMLDMIRLWCLLILIWILLWNDHRKEKEKFQRKK